MNIVRLALLPLLLPCPARCAAGSYRVTGVVVSTREGAPVPYCRITAAAVPASQIGSAKKPNAGQQVSARGPGSQPNIGRGGMSGGRPPGPMGGRPGAKSDQPLETTADTSGHFTLDLPRPGAWMLTAYARGFRRQNYDEHDGFYSAVVLTEAEPVLQLTYKLTPDSVLAGLVVDEAGEAVASAQVAVEAVAESYSDTARRVDATGVRQVGSAQSDDRGRYEIGGLPPGQYRLRVEAQPWYAVGLRTVPVRITGGSLPSQLAPVPAPLLDPSLDLVYATTWFPGVDDAAAAETVVLGPGEERQVDFHLTAIPAVHLRIPRPDVPPPDNVPSQARPQPMRPIILTRASNEQGFNRMIQGNQNGGAMDFGGLAPGTYEVRFPSPDGRSDGEVRQIVVRAGSQPVITMEDSKPLVQVTVKVEGMVDGDNSMIEFTDIETGRRIQSNPQFRGRRGPRQDSDEGDDSTDEAQSLVRTIMLPTHTYEIAVNGGSGAYLTGITAKGSKVAGREVTIDGAATLTLRVAKAHAVIDGVARIEGKPAQGAMMLLVPATLGETGNLSSILRDETNTDGTFLIRGITPGRYILVAIDHGWNIQWQTPDTLARYLVHGTPVDLRSTANAHEEVEAEAP